MKQLHFAKAGALLALFIIAIFLGLGLRRSPKPDTVLLTLLNSTENISGTAVCIGNRMLPSEPRALSDKQLANVVDALRAGQPVRLDGEMFALQEGNAEVFLHIGEETVTVALHTGGSLQIWYTLDGKTHVSAPTKTGCLETLETILNELFPDPNV